MAKEDNMIKRQKEYSKSKIEYGKKIVDEMINNNETVTLYNVYKRSGLSKSFIYSNKELRDYIEQHKNNISEEYPTVNNEVKLKELQNKLDAANEEINDMKLKEWNELREEYKQLRSQLYKLERYYNITIKRLNKDNKK